MFCDESLFILFQLCSVSSRNYCSSLLGQCYDLYFFLLDNTGIFKDDNIKIYQAKIVKGRSY